MEIYLFLCLFLLHVNFNCVDESKILDKITNLKKKKWNSTVNLWIVEVQHENAGFIRQKFIKKSKHLNSEPTL